jgi:hypothetical protein
MFLLQQLHTLGLLQKMISNLQLLGAPIAPSTYPETSTSKLIYTSTFRHDENVQIYK